MATKQPRLSELEILAILSLWSYRLLFGAYLPSYVYMHTCFGSIFQLTKETKSKSIYGLLHSCI